MAVLVVKNLPANAGDIRDASLILESERFPWRWKWQSTPVFFRGKSHKWRSFWQATVHSVTKSQAPLKRLSKESG